MLEEINRVWNEGSLPPQWKEALIIPIPKPGKQPNSIDNFRPISLTSCVGKVMEKMVLRRLEWHMESQNILPETMIGFRKHVSTQDAMLRLKQQIFDNPSSAQLRTVAGIDMSKAFDGVLHTTILNNLKEIYPGRKIYNYIKDFLSNRKAKIKLDDFTSDSHPITRGTPQGSILSPTLFNIVMKNLPKQLNLIQGLEHSIYADDITVWTTTGSPGEQEEIMQKGIDTIQDYASSIGLTCSAEKSEYVVITQDTTSRASEYRGMINLTIDGKPLPRRNSLRILGYLLQNDGKFNLTINKLTRQIEQILAMLRRITRQKRGMKEHELRKVIEALIYSRVMYHLPYIKLTKTQHAKLETALRKATRLSLGVPRYAANHKVEAT